MSYCLACTSQPSLHKLTLSGSLKQVWNAWHTQLLAPSGNSKASKSRKKVTRFVQPIQELSPPPIKHSFMVKIRFIPPPPSFFIGNMFFWCIFWLQDFFSSMAFLLEMHNKRDMIFWNIKISRVIIPLTPYSTVIATRKSSAGKRGYMDLTAKIT